MGFWAKLINALRFYPLEAICRRPSGGGGGSQGQGGLKRCFTHPSWQAREKWELALLKAALFLHHVVGKIMSRPTKARMEENILTFYFTEILFFYVFRTLVNFFLKRCYCSGLPLLSKLIHEESSIAHLTDHSALCIGILVKVDFIKLFTIYWSCC